MKAIGVHFSTEIQAAGLAGLPFGWSSDGTITFGPDMTQQQIDAVNVVYAAHDPLSSVPVEAARISAIKAEGRSIIRKAYSMESGKQSAMHMRTSEYLYKRAMAVALTDAEAADEQVLLNANAWMKSVSSAEKTAIVNNVAPVWPVAVAPVWNF